MPQWIIHYEWALFFGLILVLAIADLIATQRGRRRDDDNDRR